MSPRTGLLALLLASTLGGCGGAVGTAEPRSAADEDPCPRLRAEASEAAQALAACRETSPAWAHQASFDRALAGVRSLAPHTQAPRTGPVPTEEAQRAADGVWELLDEVSPEMTRHAALDRAENAAEALLRDRNGDVARAAVIEAEAALAEVRAVLVPEPTPDACDGETRAAREAAEASARCE